jgi:hypothetical protein
VPLFVPYNVPLDREDERPVSLTDQVTLDGWQARARGSDNPISRKLIDVPIGTFCASERSERLRADVTSFDVWRANPHIPDAR